MVSKNLNVFPRRLKQIELFLFDFDGVFTSGKKGENFNQRDLMGISMLRFGYYLISKKIPEIGIVTGENNEIAKNLAQREHFNYIFLGVRDKKSILKLLGKKGEVDLSKAAIIYDDINDLSLVEKANLRFLVNQSGSSVFHELLKKQKKYDYLTKSLGGQGAVREICELILDSLGIYSQCVGHRASFSKTYQEYWQLINSIDSSCFISKENKLQQIK